MESHLLEHNTAARVRLPGAIAAKPWIDAHELRSVLDTERAPVIVDVRGLCEFFSGPLGCLPTAINVPLPQLPDCIKEFDPLRPGASSPSRGLRRARIERRRNCARTDSAT